MKQQLKKQAVSIIAASLILSGGAVYAESTQAIVTPAQVISTVPSQHPFRVIANDQNIATSGFMNKDNHTMVQLREIYEALGFNVTKHQDKQSAEVSLVKSLIWTMVTTDVDQYAYNKMNVQLGAKPTKIAGKLYVPATFFSEVMRGQVVTEGN